MITAKSDSRPWYRQLWPWLLLLIPTFGITLSLITVSVAFQYADEGVRQIDQTPLSKSSWLERP